MTSKTQSLQDDLAFMRQLAEGGPASSQPQFGAAYLAGGLIYGAQCLFNWGQIEGWIRLPPGPSLVISLGFTGVFLAVMVALTWAYRGAQPRGLTNRAVAAAFAGAGLSNCALIAVFATVAARHHSLTIWLLYPTVVFALQGAVWFVVAMLRRRLWMGAVALGWWTSAVGLGLTIDSTAYVAVCGLSLILWMALPGVLMLRQARQAA